MTVGSGARPRRPLAVLVTTGVLVVAVLVASVPLFLRPAQDDVGAVVAAGGVEAVLVPGGGFGERLDAALALVAAHRVAGLEAPTVLLATTYEAPVQTCGSLPGLPDVRLECFRPDPFTTSGEALHLAERAAEAGWTRVAVADSDYHLTRTRVLVGRCLDALAPDADAAWLAGTAVVGPLRRSWLVAQEWVSLLGAPLDHLPPCRG